ncbi:DUF4307 domain-containing protein [Leucobacter sp. GX24907]
MPSPAPTEPPLTDGSADTERAALEERYGTSRRRGIDRRFGWITAGVLVVAGLAFFFFAGWQQSSTVEVRDLDYSVESDYGLTVRFEVTADPEARVACAVEALNTSKAVVGWKVVEIPRNGERSHTVTTSLTTTNRATTGHAKTCWLAEE